MITIGSNCDIEEFEYSSNRCLNFFPGLRIKHLRRRNEKQNVHQYDELVDQTKCQSQRV